ncbi:alpha/beta family hydrolase [Microbacterium elymi]|uniref:Dienelactone hydrolase family protein n=1 Tax=Microbacterium elymi TaxID=2909587 RepID=A0ABY5NK27_9MICO|nr:alpha/beta family hydrolase [Microbacterium elymi]UUT35515.1 dienelactone hydrolase family protein [Microbacterium elymi]
MHPPGRPDRPRAEHLPQITAPQLFLSGTRDPFVDPHAQLEEAVASCRHAELQWVDGAGHGFDVAGHKHPAADVGADIAARALDWIAAL